MNKIADFVLTLGSYDFNVIITDNQEKIKAPEEVVSPIEEEQGDEESTEVVDTPVEPPVQTKSAWEIKADAIISLGENFMGVPYLFGAETGDTSKFDCSSFMQYIFGKNGIELPRTSRKQSLVGTRIKSVADLRKGDLIFFTTKARVDNTGIARIGHVGVYAGDNKILHTFRNPEGVTYSSMASGTWWFDHLEKAMRVITG